MACLEHLCTSCDWSDFSNVMIKLCPKCGGTVKNVYDEEGIKETEIDICEQEEPSSCQDEDSIV